MLLNAIDNRAGTAFSVFLMSRDVQCKGMPVRPMPTRCKTGCRALAGLAVSTYPPIIYVSTYAWSLPCFRSDLHQLQKTGGEDVYWVPVAMHMDCAAMMANWLYLLFTPHTLIYMFDWGS